jgi:hypothetical protein
MQEVRCSNHRATILPARPRGLFLFLHTAHTAGYILGLTREEPLSQLDIFCGPMA